MPHLRYLSAMSTLFVVWPALLHWSAMVGCWVQPPALPLRLLAQGLLNLPSLLGYSLAAKFGVTYFPWGDKFILPTRLRLVILLLFANLVSCSRCWQSHFGE